MIILIYLNFVIKNGDNFFGSFLIINYGASNIGYVVLEESGKVSDYVIDALKENSSARVIVILEEPESIGFKGKTKEEKSQGQKEEIPQKIQKEKEMIP